MLIIIQKNKITASQVLITLAILMVFVSVALPVYLYGSGLSCNSEIRKSGIENSKCATPIISHAYGTPEYKAVTDEYKHFIYDHFNGGKMVFTTSFMALYMFGLLGGAFFVFTGNSFTNTWRVFAGIGLFFADTIFVVLAFTFFLKELIEMDGTFMLNSLVTIPAVVGIVIYLVVFYLYYRRQQGLEELMTTLDGEVEFVYSGELPAEIESARLNAWNNLSLASQYLGRNVISVYRVEETHSKVEGDLQQIENKALIQVLAEIDQSSSQITDALRSAFDSTHVDPDQVKTVFFRLVRTTNHRVLSDFIRRMNIQT